MLQYPQEIPTDFTMRYMAWHNIKNLNQILHFWNLWVKGFQTVYRMSKSVDILEEALLNTIYEVAIIYYMEWHHNWCEQKRIFTKYNRASSYWCWLSTGEDKTVYPPLPASSH